jgi:hypothetical protein
MFQRLDSTIFPFSGVDRTPARRVATEYASLAGNGRRGAIEGRACG